MALLVFFQTYKKNNLEYKFNILNDRTKALKNDLKIQSDFEGKFLWDVTNITKESFEKIKITNKINSNCILFCVDSITCISCFNFHVENINQLPIKKIIIYSPLHPEYVQSFFKNGIIYNSVKDKNWDTDKLLLTKMVINCVDISGQIIYSDVADKFNYGKSRKFYKKVIQYINSSSNNS